MKRLASSKLFLGGLVIGLVVGGTITTSAARGPRKVAVTATTIQSPTVEWVLSGASFTDANCDEDTWTWSTGLGDSCPHYVATLPLGALPSSPVALPRLVSKTITIQVPSAAALNIPDQVDGNDVRCLLQFPGSWTIDGETYGMNGSNYIWSPRSLEEEGRIYFDGTDWNESEISFKAVYMIPPSQTVALGQKLIFMCAEWAYDLDYEEWMITELVRLQEPATAPITISNISVTSSTFGA